MTEAAVGVLLLALDTPLVRGQLYRPPAPGGQGRWGLEKAIGTCRDRLEK